MEIQPQISQPAPGRQQPGNVKTGDNVQAVIKEKVSGREAVVEIRGKEQKAVFENGVPDKTRVQVEVTEKKDGVLHVRETQQTKQTPESGAQQRLSQLGVSNPSESTIKAAEAFMKNGVPMDRESAQALDRFMKEGEGTRQSRMETALVAAEKKLTPGQRQLEQIHLARSGAPLRDALPQTGRQSSGQEAREALFKSSEQSFPPEVRRAVQQLAQAMETGSGVRRAVQQLQEAAGKYAAKDQQTEVQQLLKQMLTSQASGGKAAAAETLRAFLSEKPQEAPPVQEGRQLSAGRALQQAAAAPDLQTALVKLEAEAVKSGSSRELVEALGRAREMTAPLLESGRELKAREAAAQILERVPDNPRAQAQIPASLKQELEAFVRQQMPSSENAPQRLILVTEVTETLARSADTFKQFQREQVQHLSRTEQILQSSTQQAKQAQPLLETSIRQLQQAVTKSDWLLYADMKQERTVMKASAMLTEAKTLASQGKGTEAANIVREVKQTLSAIQFQPSNKRIHHAASLTQTAQDKAAPVQTQAAQRMEEASRMITKNDHSARQVLEGMRMLGLTRESDIAQQLASGKVPAENQMKDVKSLLMQAARQADDDSRQPLQQLLSQLQGQQLVNRNESQHPTHHFQLPMQLKDQDADLHVYVQSREAEGGMDWENMQLYFHISTPSMGDVGINLQIANREIGVTLKNDNPAFAGKAEPLAEKYIGNLEEIGYKIKSIRTGQLSESPQLEKPAPDAEKPVSEKGFDFKI
ncbi:hypothetical protein [Alkalicoccus urumqiensis]|uniref:Flagellar hook-length control protein-like C-terminal domain-containing protein n=1 Tax=Alkalicoccus urumqiensis TaxID=1548213 RepID=A0A2P6MKE0_ALKUR|nr:hypothetical protein [Alkalicoccus urumqiensis]PRO66738.1 hypothetical protein C6I21_02080 [Alkalicoccus urumqiensis]